MGPAVYSVTLNGAPAAASPQVNEFWVDRRLSAHPLHREEALGGEGRRQQRSPGWRGAEGVGQRGDLRGSVPVPEADLRTARGPSASVSPAYPEPQLAGPPAPSGPPAPDYRVSGPKVRTALAPKTTRSHLVRSCACAKADARGPGGSPPPESLPLLLALRAL